MEEYIALFLIGELIITVAILYYFYRLIEEMRLHMRTFAHGFAKRMGVPDEFREYLAKKKEEEEKKKAEEAKEAEEQRKKDEKFYLD